MMPNQIVRKMLGAALATCSLCTAGLNAHAQTPQSPSAKPRIAGAIDESARVALPGTLHPLAKPANDRGALPDSTPLDRMQIRLTRSAEQEKSLRQLLAGQHQPGSSSYHKWLTPAQFGAQFGPSDSDIATIKTWLSGHGFHAISVTPGRQAIEFSGTAGQFRDAFKAEIHQFSVNGAAHYANASEPSIPAALAPVIGGFPSLNNFPLKSYAVNRGAMQYKLGSGKATPSWTVGSTDGDILVLAPGDFAVQYDLNPLYQAGTNGSGQKIAIVNESNIDLSLVNRFRSIFSLPANPPQVVIDGNDPGIDGVNNPDGENGASTEAYLDVEWAGAVAPNAEIDLVIAGDTALANGLLLAAEHAVYGNVAPVLSLSFGACETNLAASNQFFNDLWEQAAAQGITVLVSSGDSASATCDSDNQEYAVNGTAVNGFASTPWNVAVGGTDFYYTSWNQGQSAIAAQLANYWATSSGTTLSTSNDQPVVSLLQPIPEQPWNESQYGLNLGGYTGGPTNIVGGGGGPSTAGLYTPGQNFGFFSNPPTVAPYPKPSWQTGTGVPADGARDLPDVALFASSGANASLYPICAADGDCQPVAAGHSVQFTGVGGTSASTPAFAGILSLVNQQYGPQGQANYVLYPLATQFPAAFHDVTTGSNSVPCNIEPVGTEFNTFYPTDCIAVSDPVTATDPTYGTSAEGQTGDTTAGTASYLAGTGYDLASGLGSVDAAVLVADWPKVSFAGTTTTLTPSATTFAHGTPVTISGAVIGMASGSGVPTGAVALKTTSTEPIQTGQNTFLLAPDGTYTGSVNSLPGGTYQLLGEYGGDSANAASSSTPVQVTVTPEDSSLILQALNAAFASTQSAAVANNGTVSYGSQVLMDAQPVPVSYYTECVVQFPPSDCATAVFGTATGSIVYTDGGAPLATVPLNAGGTAEVNQAYSVGPHSVTASYAGDNSYHASSASLNFTVLKTTPDIFFGGPSMQTGEPLTFAIQVVNPASLNTAYTENSVQWVPALAPTGSVTISGLPSGSPTSATLAPSFAGGVLAPQGVANIVVPSDVPAGTYTVTIAYAGDANYLASSQSFRITFTAPSGLAQSSLALSAATTTTSSAAFIDLVATVTGQNSAKVPTGNVEFFTSGSAIGLGTLVPGTNGTAVFQARIDSGSLVRGFNEILAQYTGDSNYQGSSASITLNNGTAPGSETPSFVLSGSTPAPIDPGSTSTSTVLITPANGFSGNVTLACAVSPANLASTPTCSVSAPAAISGNTAASATLTVTTQSTTAEIAAYTVTVTGTGGGSMQTTSIAVPFLPHVSVSATPLASVSDGGSASSTLTVTPIAGLSGFVSLSCSVTSTGSGPAPACSVSPSSVLLSGSSPATATLAVTVPQGVAAGSYNVSVTATDGAATQTAALSLGVNAPFTLSASSVSATAAGLSASSTITIAPNNFVGQVALSCSVTPANLAGTPSCSLNPDQPVLSDGTPATSVLTVVSGPTTAPATYTVTVTGASGALSTSVNVPVVFTAQTVSPAFSLTGTSVSLTAGASGTSTITLTPVGGFTGQVSLTCSVIPANLPGTPICTPTNPPAISGTGAVTATVLLTTSPSTTASLLPGESSGGASAIRYGGVALASLLCCFVLPLRRRGWKTLLSLVLLTLAVAATQGCGTSNHALPNVGGTARGTYTVSITGAGANGTTATTTISLTVQ
jgi:hypothetical protein